ncbi:MAG: transglutaminase family protein [Bacteroidia bacterium]|nr:transglutaminase family protein [Bacteroidia bacterium]
MKFEITHETSYLFSSEVFLEPHYFRFYPRQNSYLEVQDFSMYIAPSPKGQKQILDDESNTVVFCWFEGMTESLTITTKSIIENKPFNPFDFILYPQSFNEMPFKYDETQKKSLYFTLEKQDISKALSDYGEDILKASENNTIQFLSQFTKQLHKDFSIEYREVGSPMSPDETFILKKGSCRDLAWLQINVLRHLGAAARFVSGYYYFDMEVPAFELHAWTEVFLPGTGWLGLDPSHGILTGNTHFPIASSAHYENTMPVSGGIRGSANSKLITELTIKKI